ncbi:DNA internalization-related competence protein ComEC/Rec2, partial [Staphylococcus saprophyticus]
MIIIVPFIAFGLFYRYYHQTLEFQNDMLSKSLIANAKFITKPVISDNTLSGKLQIDSDYYQYYFKPNRKVKSSDSSELYRRDCKIHGAFKFNGEGISRKLYIN